MTQVTPLFGGEVQSCDKQAMLDYVAKTFDELAAEGKAPVCLVFSLVSELGAMRSGYMTADKIADRNCLYISRAMQGLQGDYDLWDSTDRAPD